MFASLDRAIIKRSTGKFESWLCLHWQEGNVVLGAELHRGPTEKVVSPDALKAWAAEAKGKVVTPRAASEAQIDMAFDFAKAQTA